MKLLVLLLGICILIIDPESSLQSARDSVEMCTGTVIPSLLPLLFITSLLRSYIAGSSHIPLYNIFRIPNGGESFLISGFLGGYPLGTVAIRQAAEDRSISAETSRLLLGFCNNAGPAFIFGIAAPVLHSQKAAFGLWGTVIFSSLITARILPSIPQRSCSVRNVPARSPSETLEASLSALASICGWVILFGVVLHFFRRWVLWIFPIPVQVLISGIIELTGGCMHLSEIGDGALSFVICSALMSFGGLCVYMQVLSQAGWIGAGWYLPGKIIQAQISTLTALILCPILFGIWPGWGITLGIGVSLTLLISICFLKKEVAFPNQLKYNSRKCM